MDATPTVLLWDRGSLETACERSAIVRDGVETYLGRKVFADAGERSVRVQLSRVEVNGKRRVVARVTQEDEDGRASGERNVDGDDSCASLDEQLILVVALLVDTPDAAASTAEPAAPPPPPPPPPPKSDAEEPSSEIVTAPSLQRPAASPAHLVVLGFGAVSAGATPAPAIGGGVLLSYKPRGFWGLGLEGSLFGPTREKLEAGSLEIGMLNAAGSVCPLQGSEEHAWWSACASVGVARLRTHSRGLLEARDRTQWFALPGMAVRGAAIVARHWLLGGGVLATVPISPERYVYRDVEGRTQSAFQLSSLVLTAQIGVGWILN